MGFGFGPAGEGGDTAFLACVNGVRRPSPPLAFVGFGRRLHRVWGGSRSEQTEHASTRALRAIKVQPARNQRATSVQSARNQRAISVQSARNQRAITGSASTVRSHRRVLLFAGAPPGSSLRWGVCTRGRMHSERSMQSAYNHTSCGGEKRGEASV